MYYFLPSRRYVSVELSSCVCVCLCVCHTPVIVSKRLHGSRLFLCVQISLDLCYAVFREIRISPDITVLPYRTLSRTLDLENFATAHSTVGECNINSDRG